MTCKDCIHCDVCSEKDGTTNFYGKEFACNDVEKRCQYFKNKSLIVELPCKVGDKVYRPSKCLGVVQFIITSLNIYQSELFFTDDSENIIYLPEIGKTVFLTKEEAEAKLKELNNEH